MLKTELFTVDGQPMLVPDGDLAMQEEDVISSDSGLDDTGVYHRFVIRRNVPSWDFSYSRLSRDEYAYLESLFADKDTFSFGYWSAIDENWKQVMAYRSKRTILWHNATDGQFREYRFRIIAC